MILNKNKISIKTLIKDLIFFLIKQIINLLNLIKEGTIFLWCTSNQKMTLKSFFFWTPICILLWYITILTFCDKHISEMLIFSFLSIKKSLKGYTLPPLLMFKNLFIYLWCM